MLSTTKSLAFGTGVGRVTTPGIQAYMFAPMSAQQLTATITSDVDLNTLSAGAIVVNVFYVVLA